MNYLKNSLVNTWDFLKDSNAYFRDVLLMHGALLFLVIPILSASTKFVLKRGACLTFLLIILAVSLPTTQSCCSH